MDKFIVEGPIGYYYYEIDDNKKILLFADKHESYKSKYNFPLGGSNKENFCHQSAFNFSLKLKVFADFIREYCM